MPCFRTITPSFWSSLLSFSDPTPSIGWLCGCLWVGRGVGWVCVCQEMSDAPYPIVWRFALCALGQKQRLGVLRLVFAEFCVRS